MCLKGPSKLKNFCVVNSSIDVGKVTLPSVRIIEFYFNIYAVTVSKSKLGKDSMVPSRTDHSLVFNISVGSLEGLLSCETNGSLVSNGTNQIVVHFSYSSVTGAV